MREGVVEWRRVKDSLDHKTSQKRECLTTRGSVLISSVLFVVRGGFVDCREGGGLLEVLLYNNSVGERCQMGLSMRPTVCRGHIGCSCHVCESASPGSGRGE